MSRTRTGIRGARLLRALSPLALFAILPSVGAPAAVATMTAHADLAPPGIDIRHRPSLDELRGRDQESATANGTATGTAAAATAPGGTVYCYGDGVSGKRVEGIYAHAAGVTDRYASLKPSFQTWAANVDGVFNRSAAETGGERHVRFATDSKCQLVVRDVQLSATGDDTYGNAVAELRNLGYNRTDRDYILWMDSTVYCGIAAGWTDDKSGADNTHNNGSYFARVDSGCWGLSAPVEAHELMHLLGGVSTNAPHKSANYHCTDESDRMCYQDGSGVTMTHPCVSAHESAFDCNHDDYYSTNPAAGSWLATHWNTANSVYLERVAGSTTGLQSTTPPPPVTDTYTAVSASGGRSYVLLASAGTLSANLTWNASILFPPSLSLTIKDGAGRTVATKSSTSSFTLSAPVSAGRYTVVVGGTSNINYTLKLTYNRG